MPAPKNMRAQGHSEKIFIQLDLSHDLSEEVKNQTQPFKGLINEGTTCYLNSLIQTLFFLREFRSAIYKMPTELQIQKMNSNDSQSLAQNTH